MEKFKLGLDILREINNSREFDHIKLIGGNAVNFHILNKHNYIPDHLITDFDVEIYTNGNYNVKEPERVMNKIKDILVRYDIKQYNEFKFLINDIEFDFFINEIEPKKSVIIDDIHVISYNGALEQCRISIRDFEIELEYQPKTENDYIKEKLKRYRIRYLMLI